MPRLITQGPLTGRIGEPPPRTDRAPVGPPSSPTVGRAQDRRRASAPMPAPQARYAVNLDPVAWDARAESERRAAGLTLWPADALTLYPAPTPPAWLRAEREAAARDQANEDHAAALAWAEDERSFGPPLAAEHGSAATAALVVMLAWAVITAAALATVAPVVGGMLR